MAYRALSDADVDHFIRKGYVKLEQAFPREVAEEWSRNCFQRLGYDPNDTAPPWRAWRMVPPPGRQFK